MTSLRNFMGALWIGTALGAALVSGAWAQDAARDLDQTVATANGEAITLGEFLAMKDLLPPEFFRGEPQSIFDAIVKQIAVQREIQNTAKDTAELEFRKAAALRTTVVNDAIDAYVDEQVTEERLQAQYDTLIGNAPDTEEWNASHILVETEDDANAAIGRINGGEDFAEVAKELSSDGSAASGGELGWFGAGQMVPEFQGAVEALEVGGLSAPVQSQFGWHVVKLNDKRIAAKPTLDEVREQLTQFVQQDVVNSYIAEIDAKIEVTPAEGVDLAIIEDNL